MNNEDPTITPQFSREAVKLIDQLHDIAHDVGWENTEGIAWFLPDEEPPWEALDELTTSGWFAVTREEISGGDELALECTAAGIAHYRSADDAAFAGSTQPDSNN